MTERTLILNHDGTTATFKTTGTATIAPQGATPSTAEVSAATQQAKNMALNNVTTSMDFISLCAENQCSSAFITTFEVDQVGESTIQSHHAVINEEIIVDGKPKIIHLNLWSYLVTSTWEVYKICTLKSKITPWSRSLPTK